MSSVRVHFVGRSLGDGYDMIRFLVFSDLHISDGPPSQRDDSYFEDILAKVRELGKVACGLCVDATIIAGDLFHRKNPQHISHKLVQRFGAVLSDFGGPVLAVPGNHDYTGNIEALHRSPYGVLREFDAIHDLSTWPKSFADGQGVDAKTFVHVTGAAYEPGEPAAMYALPKIDGGIEALSVHVCHGMLMPTRKTRPFEFTPIADIEDQAARITVVGHYHPGWGVEKRGGRIFYAPGSVARISTHEHDITRAPKYGILSVDRVDGKWKAGIKEREVPGVRPADAVFSLDAVTAKATREKELVQFEESLSPTSLETVAVDVQDAARALADENDLDGSVLAEMLSLLAEAED